MNNNSYCTNCGYNTHHNKECLEPITSYGLILYTYDEKKKKLMYLMICRKNTIGFIELIRGHYDSSNIEYLTTLCSVLTLEESQMCLTMSHQQLWDTMWKDRTNQSDYWKKEYLHSATKWIECENIIKSVISSKVYCFPYPEWGFPKGRKNYRETNIETAMREMYEETHIPYNAFTLLNLPPVKEEYMSYDGNLYRNIYYIGRINTWVNLNIPQHSEVSRIRLLTYDICMNRIRPYETHKKDLLTSLNDTLEKIHITQ
jgi:hypothetical protein